MSILNSNFRGKKVNKNKASSRLYKSRFFNLHPHNLTTTIRECERRDFFVYISFLIT
jgi:hypothetical protein